MRSQYEDLPSMLLEAVRLRTPTRPAPIKEKGQSYGAFASRPHDIPYCPGNACFRATN